MMHVTGRRISIRDLRFTGIVGVFAEERSHQQTLSCSVDIDFECPPDREPTFTDRIQDTIDYESVIRDIMSVSAAQSPMLLERLARLIAEKISVRYPGIRSISITLQKVPTPVKDIFAESIGVSITFTPENPQ
jgi:dihydroneopterin aldolase|uniref:dihydroneopterin aldolase n=1 Tax=Leptospirillum ferriphilum TaxID=178606 RepID=A0A7C3LSL7_9BACT